ncbi:MAG: outer membrane beta-barrel protein [Methylocystis sp.]
MKKILLSATALSLALTASAFAADLPSRKAPVYIPPPPPLTWNGFYAGLNIGGGWNANNDNNEVSAYWDPRLPFGSSFFVPGQGFTPNLFFLPNGNQTGTAGGIVGGGQVGYNFQFNPSIVIGVETDFQGSSIGNNDHSQAAAFYASPFFAPSGLLVPVSAINGGHMGIDWIGTVRGRVGWLFMPSLLVYGTAGFAYAGAYAWGYDDTRTGWTAGGGLEWMLAPNISAKLEYLYADLNSGGATGTYGWNWGYHFHPELNIVRAGVNYHFNWAAPAPVLAKY